MTLIILGSYHRHKKANGTDNADNDQFFRDKIYRQVMQSNDTNYVVPWYGYPLEEDTVERPQHLPHYFVIRYWRNVNYRIRQDKLC